MGYHCHCGWCQFLRNEGPEYGITTTEPRATLGVKWEVSHAGNLTVVYQARFVACQSGERKVDAGP